MLANSDGNRWPEPLGGNSTSQSPFAFVSGPDRNVDIAMTCIGTIGFSAVAYYIWKNSPAERAKGYKENLGPGEWYLAAYSGLSYLPAADWKFVQFLPPYQGRTAKNIEYNSGLVGGVKFGRYLDALPWFGWELETNFSRDIIRGGQGPISPRAARATQAFSWG